DLRDHHAGCGLAARGRSRRAGAAGPQAQGQAAGWGAARRRGVDGRRGGV
ncbi:MAG: Formate dehydrogenase O putative subunit, partial [uncultured Blastococcus sp.]